VLSNPPRRRRHRASRRGVREYFGHPEIRNTRAVRHQADWRGGVTRKARRQSALRYCGMPSKRNKRFRNEPALLCILSLSSACTPMPSRNGNICSFKHGIRLPIHVGIAGPTSLSKLIRFAMLCGIGASLRTVIRNLSAGGGIADLDYQSRPACHALDAVVRGDSGRGSALLCLWRVAGNSDMDQPRALRKVRDRHHERQVQS